jgi:type IV secretory pathway VirB2 component (pilin)
MTIAVLVALLVAVALILMIVYSQTSQPQTDGWAGGLTWALPFLAGLAAVCYLLTLAVGLVQP